MVEFLTNCYMSVVMLRRPIIALAVASALGISFCPTDASARRTRAAVADGVPSWDLTASCRIAKRIDFYLLTASGITAATLLPSKAAAIRVAMVLDARRSGSLSK